MAVDLSSENINISNIDVSILLSTTNGDKGFLITKNNESRLILPTIIAHSKRFFP